MTTEKLQDLDALSAYLHPEETMFPPEKILKERQKIMNILVTEYPRRSVEFVNMGDTELYFFLEELTRAI